MFIKLNNGKQAFFEVPEEGLMQLLTKKTATMGRLLTREEVKSDPEMAPPNTFAFYFGSFGEAANKAWRMVRTHQMPLGNGEQFGRRSIAQGTMPRPVTRKPFRLPAPKEKASAPVPAELDAPVNSQRINQQETSQQDKIITQLTEYYLKHHKLPSKNDRDCDPNLPSYTTIHRCIGPKRDWLIVIRRKIASDPKLSERFTASTDAKKTSTDVTTGVARSERTSGAGLVPQSKPSEAAGQDKDVHVETSYQVDDDNYIVKMKIVLPGREKPILVTVST